MDVEQVTDPYGIKHGGHQPSERKRQNYIEGNQAEIAQKLRLPDITKDSANGMSRSHTELKVKHP